MSMSGKALLTIISKDDSLLIFATIPFGWFGHLFILGDNTVMLQMFGLLKLIRALRIGRLLTFIQMKESFKFSLTFLED
jgi:hypothetical protein